MCKKIFRAGRVRREEFFWATFFTGGDKKVAQKIPLYRHILPHHHLHHYPLRKWLIHPPEAYEAEHDGDMQKLAKQEVKELGG